MEQPRIEHDLSDVRSTAFGPPARERRQEISGGSKLEGLQLRTRVCSCGCESYAGLHLRNLGDGRDESMQCSREEVAVTLEGFVFPLGVLTKYHVVYFVHWTRVKHLHWKVEERSADEESRRSPRRGFREASAWRPLPF